MSKTDPLYPNVVFYGAPGSGKSTAAAFLEDLGFTRVSFAGLHPGGVRDIARRAFGEDATTNRTILVAIGQGFRALDEDVWVRNLLRHIDAHPGVAWVNDDLRAPNEWWTLRARGWVFVRVRAGLDLRTQRLERIGKPEVAAPEGLQTLEGLLDDERIFRPDHTVYNEGSISELQQQLVNILNIERSKRT